ncbi:hypothetical protein [Actinokineospora iranica]|uniref:Uncharacterized protein n=1 Tax=Actinokineospora iranica TaxID=1271860 RepID=A0A1G6R1G6_9PSEU|nr:hypothetical protein [Actinokineospora iranica]SDC98351.1 hypothetical protein SAMN05216174_10686 [Actinokineospora iranica]
MRVPFAVQASALKLAGVAVFSVLVALVFAFAGAFRDWSHAPEQPVTVSATVLIGVPCARSGVEQVAYTLDGVEHHAPLDACGHEQGETIEITLGAGETVHLAQATSGATLDARPVGVVLMVFAGMAGAGFAELYRRRAPA